MFSGWDKNTFAVTGSIANYFDRNVTSPLKQFTTNALNFSPAGNVKSAAEAVSGKDLLTGSTLSTTDRFLSGVGAIPAFGVAGTIGKGVLKEMKLIGSAEAKLSKLSSQFGKTSGEILEYVQQNGRPLLDTVSGNINYVAKKFGDAEGYIRITAEPTLNRIISAGQNTVRNIVNGIEKGRFKEIK